MVALDTKTKIQKCFKPKLAHHLLVGKLSWGHCGLMSQQCEWHIDWTLSFSNHSWVTMEVKVFVDGIPRVVCGVTEETTCQEVVIALAQALGMYACGSVRFMFWHAAHGENHIIITSIIIRIINLPFQGNPDATHSVRNLKTLSVACHPVNAFWRL